MGVLCFWSFLLVLICNACLRRSQGPPSIRALGQSIGKKHSCEPGPRMEPDSFPQRQGLATLRGNPGRRRLREKRKTWKLGAKPGAGARRMRIVDLTAPSLASSVLQASQGSEEEQLDVDPATCGTPKACPDFTLCTSGGADTSSGGKGTGEATGAISLCTNSWLTELGSQQNDSDPEGFDCPITVERVHGTERVRDEAGQCEETKRVFGEAAEEGDGDAGWRGGVALLENVFVNQHGDVFNDTHHFYFGACTASEEAREPGRLFAKVWTGLGALPSSTG